MRHSKPKKKKLCLMPNCPYEAQLNSPHCKAHQPLLFEGMVIEQPTPLMKKQRSTAPAVSLGNPAKPAAPAAAPPAPQEEL